LENFTEDLPMVANVFIWYVCLAMQYKYFWRFIILWKYWANNDACNVCKCWAKSHGKENHWCILHI